MRCSKAAKRISEYIDGELEPGKARRLEAHLAACPGCGGLIEDLRTVSRMARDLEIPPVPDDSWGRIRSGLRNNKAPVPGTPSFGRFKLAYGLAAAAVATISLGVLFFSLKRNAAVPSGLEQRERYTLAKLDEAEKYYVKAIKSLGEALADEKGRLSPDVAEMFARNMEAVDASIRACRLAVRNEPGDVKTRDFLLAAYRKKLVLLDDLLDINRNAFPSQAPGKAL